MTYGELRRRLRRLGVRLVRQGRNHEIWGIPNSQRITSIARHRGEVPLGTLRRILRDLGISQDDLQNS